MRHPVDTEALSAWVEGDLSAAERARVEAHLDGCASCRAELEALRRTILLSAELGDAPPARDLWPAIDRALDRPEGWLSRLFGAGGASAIVPWAIAGALAAAWVVVLLRSPSAPSPSSRAAGEPAGVVEARKAYASAIARLELAARGSEAALPDEVRRRLARNLAEVDRAIGECEALLLVHPDDVDGQQLLLAMYDEKVRVLDAVIEAGDKGGQP
jgi:anti-sigma factor RsiW